MKIEYTTRRTTILGCQDAAWVSADESLSQAVADSVVESLSTSVEVTLGGITIHLAALLDPDHWEEDWKQAGVDDPDEFLRGLVVAA